MGISNILHIPHIRDVVPQPPAYKSLTATCANADSISLNVDRQASWKCRNSKLFEAEFRPRRCPAIHWQHLHIATSHVRMRFPLNSLACAISLVVVATIAPGRSLSAQTHADSTAGAMGPHREVPPTVGAVRLTAPISLDGRLDEEAWRIAEPASGFRQTQPAAVHFLRSAGILRRQGVDGVDRAAATVERAVLSAP